MKIENIKEVCSKCGNKKNLTLSNKKNQSALFCLQCGAITAHLDVLIYEDQPDFNTPIKSEDNLLIVFTLKNDIVDVAKLSDIYSVEQNFLGLVIDDETALSSLLEIIDFDQLKLLLENVGEEFGYIDELNSMLRNGDKKVILTQDDATRSYIVVLKEDGHLSKSNYSDHSLSEAIHNVFVSDSILGEKFRTQMSLEDQKALAEKLRPLIGYVENASDVSITLSYNNGLYKMGRFDDYRDKTYWQMENESLEELINKAYDAHKDDCFN